MYPKPRNKVLRFEHLTNPDPKPEEPLAPIEFYLYEINHNYIKQK